MPHYSVIDDYVSTPSQVIISGLLNNPGLPWFYNKSTTLSKERNQRHQFVNTFVRNGELDQPEEDVNLLKDLLPFPEWNTHKCLRIKFNLNTPYKNRGILKPHVDVELPGIVYLYYVNDSDGDTILYPKIKEGSEYKWWQFRDTVRIKPKQGRVVRMSTDLWHTGNNPYRYEKRVVGNFVFVDSEVDLTSLQN